MTDEEYFSNFEDEQFTSVLKSLNEKNLASRELLNTKNIVKNKIETLIEQFSSDIQKNNSLQHQINKFDVNLLKLIKLSHGIKPNSDDDILKLSLQFYKLIFDDIENDKKSEKNCRLTSLKHNFKSLIYLSNIIFDQHETESDVSVLFTLLSHENDIDVSFNKLLLYFNNFAVKTVIN